MIDPPLYYILEPNGTTRPAEHDEFDTWWRANRHGICVIGRDQVEQASVRTDFVGRDFNFEMTGPPILFETMIFGGDHDLFQWRWRSRERATRGHALIVAALREGRSPEAYLISQRTPEVDE